MKTLLAVILMATSVLSFSTKASDASDNLIEAAQAYLNNNQSYIQEGYFMGMVQLYGDSTPNCIPEGIRYRDINQRVARVIAYDANIVTMHSAFKIMEYAVNKSYPCKKL